MSEHRSGQAGGADGAEPAGISRRGLLLGTGLATAAVIVGTTGSALPARKPATGKAALIISNAMVWTGDPKKFAEAVAVDAAGTIMAVGPISKVRAFNGPNTQVIDAHGATVMPGIHDGHMHPLGVAESVYYRSDEAIVGTMDQFLARMQKYLDEDTLGGPDDWFVIVFWNPTGLTDAVAHRKYLDTLDTTRPIFLRGVDGHNCWVNTRALELAGVTAATPDPAGGVFARDEDGPTGLLHDNAVGVVMSAIPPFTEEQTRKAQEAGFALAAGLGVTSILDAGGTPEQVALYAELSDAGIVSQRVRSSIRPSIAELSDPKAVVATVEAARTALGTHPRISTGTVKIMLDGVAEYPAQTAAMVDPYLDADGTPTDNYGNLYVEPAVFDAVVTELDAHRWQVHTHAIGDRAVRTSLDGFERAQRANKGPKNRHTVSHLQFCTPQDLRRFAKNGVVASMQLQWAQANTFTIEALKPFVGAERHAGVYPAGDLLAAHAVVAGGSDWPVDPLIPWNQVRTAVDRVGKYSEKGDPLYPEQGLTLNESLIMHTASTAFQMFQENLTGRIAVGMKADLVILDRDLFGVTTAEIGGTEVNYTLVNGEVVHDINTEAGKKAVARRF